jgi:septal ring factor EnvC (AmiA/AmiB activator)
MEQFRRMLLSKLRMVFENASNEVELWNRQATSQIDSQLRERRRSFRRRREALERIQTAAGELEQRIGELETADHRWQSLLTRVAERIESLRDGVRFADEAEAAVSAWPAQA